MRSLVIGAALVAGALSLVPAGPVVAGEVIVVKITNVAFSPATVRGKVGDTIEWINEDFIDHTATAKDESFDIALAVGKSARLELTHSGAIAYFCRIHPNMTGTINVD